MRMTVVAISLIIAFGTLGTSCSVRESANDQGLSASTHPSTRMPDGRQWTMENLNVGASPSYCYDNAEANCRRYGRLYTWESAQQGCRSLGAGWRLPTDEEWRELAKHFGGVHDGSTDSGRAAYNALLAGGSSGFNALLGGGRDLRGEYGRVDAHGFYWTASESGPGNAWFYNFAQGRLTLFPQSEGEKDRAFSVRCVRE